MGVCDYCNRRADAECDHPVIRRGKKHSCDRKMCQAHRLNIGGDVDLCPPHATLYELNGNRLVLGEVGLDPKREPAADEKPVPTPTDERERYHIYKPGTGWLSVAGSNGKRTWIPDRSKAHTFAGGPVLDATLKTYKLDAYVAVERTLFEKEVR